jgi:hypothetical protein
MCACPGTGVQTQEIIYSYNSLIVNRQKNTGTIFYISLNLKNIRIHFKRFTYDIGTLR